MNKKLLILGVAFLLVCTMIQAQPANFDQVVVPVDQRPRDFEEYLVQLAWMNNPSNNVLASKVKIAEQGLVQTKRNWAEDIQFTINLNQANLGIDTIKLFGTPIYKSKVPESAFYPIWNFGANFNIGKWWVRKSEIEVAKEKVKISEFDVNQRKLEVRSETLQRYHNYLVSIEIFKARTQAFETASTNKTLITEMFNTNKVEFEELNKADEAYYNALEAKIKAENQITLSKLSLEEIIGVKWEVAERFKQTGGKTGFGQ